MSNRLALALLLIALALGSCGIAAVAFRPTIDTTAAALTNHITAPDPLGDVMEVRQQAESGGRTWATVGLTLVGLLVVGAVFGWVYLKPRMDKEKRLLLKAQRRSSQPQRPLSRVLPPASLSDLPQLPRLNGVQAVQETEDGYWND
jgi:hypothetical protein